jgi:hypothetical protein
MEIQNPFIRGIDKNDVLDGFVVSDFKHIIGIDRADAQRLLTQLHALSPSDEVKLDFGQVRAARNALCETIRELGVEECDTRTGYDLDQGAALLALIDRFLSG